MKIFASIVVILIFFQASSYGLPHEAKNCEFLGSVVKMIEQEIFIIIVFKLAKERKKKIIMKVKVFLLRTNRVEKNKRNHELF
jgi:hypothetical protein